MLALLLGLICVMGGLVQLVRVGDNALHTTMVGTLIIVAVFLDVAFTIILSLMEKD